MLKHINSPKDLKARVKQEDLPSLCAEVRELIIDAVSRNGGHLAPSLGVVELATALHFVFDSPADKILWDVGHQSYAHKILTGRHGVFHTLRTEGGMSGFPKRSESEHDAFDTGHSSTSISAALGIACGMKARGDGHRAIAVIGDGSIAGGMSFEAMNHAGHKVGNLMVVLNDNEMSISPSVGAVSRFLSTYIHGRTVGRVRKKLKDWLPRIPVCGNLLYKVMQRAEETTVSFLTPGFLFEAFGFDYIGPLNGHDIDELVAVFEQVRDTPVGDKPVLVHVLTKKGKGYAPAEERATHFHGVGPFDKATGMPAASTARSFTGAFSESLLRVAAADERVVAITAAMATGTGLEQFATAYPNRFYDVGLAEAHAVTFAAGLATQGLRPVVAIYSTFLQRSYDQIMHDVCLQNLPVVFALDRAGLVGDDGPTHHGAFDISYLRAMPNMALAAPRDGAVMHGLFDIAVAHHGPMAVRYPRGAIWEGAVRDFNVRVELGKAEILRSCACPAISIWAVGQLAHEALRAADVLATKGIEAMVVDPIFIKPFDENLFDAVVERCPLVLTVEENALAGGFGSMIGELMVRRGANLANLRCVGIPDTFIQHAPQARLRKLLGLDASGIARIAREQVASSHHPQALSQPVIPECLSRGTKRAPSSPSA
jgi:1-deoxy-D-xylulose-5-phosphate synthase